MYVVLHVVSFDLSLCFCLFCQASSAPPAKKAESEESSIEKEIRQKKMELMRIEKEKLELQLASAKKEKELLEQVGEAKLNNLYFFIVTVVLTCCSLSLSVLPRSRPDLFLSRPLWCAAAFRGGGLQQQDRGEEAGRPIILDLDEGDQQRRPPSASPGWEPRRSPPPPPLLPRLPPEEEHPKPVCDTTTASRRRRRRAALLFLC